jgi:hypothetical protein
MLQILVPGLSLRQGERGSNPRPHPLILPRMTYFMHNVTLSQRSKTVKINIIYANRRETIQEWLSTDELYCKACTLTSLESHNGDKNTLLLLVLILFLLAQI